MTPSQAWRYATLYDEVTATIIELGMVVFILAGVGASVHYVRVLRRAYRRARAKRLAAILEGKK